MLLKTFLRLSQEKLPSQKCADTCKYWNHTWYYSRGNSRRQLTHSTKFGISSGDPAKQEETKSHSFSSYLTFSSYLAEWNLWKWQWSMCPARQERKKNALRDKLTIYRWTNRHGAIILRGMPPYECIISINHPSCYPAIRSNYFCINIYGNCAESKNCIKIKDNWT